MRFHFVLAGAFAISSALALPVHSPAAVARGIFDKVSTITSTKHINAPVETVIAALHDFQRMINLNPLVSSSEVDPSDPSGKTIKVSDKLPLFLGINIPTTYTAKFEAVPDGMNTDNAVAAGVKLHNEWRAVANPSGGTDLTETDTLTANFLLSGIITKQLQTSHNQLMDTLAAQLEKAA